MATNTGSIFTGSSAYSADLQNAINRAVAIASLPINQLNNDKTALTNQSNELQTLDTKFAAVQAAIQNLSEVLSGSSLQADVSDASVVTAAVSTGATEGFYSIQVSDIGAYATSLTSTSWAEDPGPPHTYQLVIGSNRYDVTPTDNSAASVAAAINARYGDQVHATVVNVGSASSPDYRISLQGAKLADLPVDLEYNGASLQTQQTVGRPAQYMVNNSGKVVSSDTRSISIATGLTVTLVSSSAAAVGITVVRSTSALSEALSSFADAYNAAAGELDAQRGQNGGPLQGQSIVYQLTQALSGLATYSSSDGAIHTLSDLGLTLGTDGKLAFSPFALAAADIANSSAVTAFFGSPTTGGFLKAASDAFNGIVDSATGILKTTESNLATQIQTLNTTIASKQAQVDALQARLQDQMSAADALIASMEQQYNYLSNMFEAMRISSEQFK